MHWIENYIDDFKAKLKLESDYAVAKHLEMSKQAMTKVRQGGTVGRKKLIRIAKALKKDPMELIATSEAQREKDPEVRAVWLKLAKEKGNK